MALLLNKEAKQSLTAINTASKPFIFKYDSCWPANEASAKSSQVADDLTATSIELRLYVCDKSLYACAIAFSKWRGQLPWIIKFLIACAFLFNVSISFLKLIIISLIKTLYSSFICFTFLSNCER